MNQQAKGYREPGFNCIKNYSLCCKIITITSHVAIFTLHVNIIGVKNTMCRGHLGVISLHPLSSKNQENQHTKWFRPRRNIISSFYRMSTQTCRYGHKKTT